MAKGSEPMPIDKCINLFPEKLCHNREQAAVRNGITPVPCLSYPDNLPMLASWDDARLWIAVISLLPNNGNKSLSRHSRYFRTVVPILSMKDDFQSMNLPDTDSKVSMTITAVRSIPCLISFLSSAAFCLASDRDRSWKAPRISFRSLPFIWTLRRNVFETFGWIRACRAVSIPSNKV